jgi:Xaa-Pro aminopeptidase
LLQPGATGHDIAVEALYTMMKAGAEGTSTPIHINTGIRSCWTHGKVDQRKIVEGDLAVVDLTPQFEGYCANLARTFVIGKPNDKQQLLLDTYIAIREATRKMLKPGVTVSELDAIGYEICARHNLEKYHLNGISHGIGLRFEETPASTIIPAHRKKKLRADMTVTVGHTILAIPGFGGVRFEDVYRVAPEGGHALHEYPVDPSVGK